MAGDRWLADPPPLPNLQKASSPGLRKAIIIDLKNQYHIRHRVVDCKNEHGRKDLLEDAANQIGQVASQPYGQESEGEPIPALPLHILEDLGREDDNPAADGDAPSQSRYTVRIQRR